MLGVDDDGEDIIKHRVFFQKTLWLRIQNKDQIHNKIETENKCTKH